MKIIYRLFCFLSLLFMSALTFAAIPPKMNIQMNMQQNHQTEIRGGVAGVGFTVLGFRRFYAGEKGIDRLVFDFGNEVGKKVIQRPGYYQLHVDNKRSRLLIDFYQITASQFTPEQFINEIKKSPFVKNARMIYDPEDKGLTLELILKEKIQASLQELPSGETGARLAIDIKRL